MDNKNFGVCRYCQQQVIWKNKKPFDAGGVRHKCTKYPRPKYIEVTRHIDPVDVERIYEEIERLKLKVEALNNPKPEPANPLVKRIERLESIIVEIRKGAQ